MTDKSIRSALHELKAAHQIIRNVLNLLTPEQKATWAFINELESCDGEGVTRANEREAVIALLEAELRKGGVHHG